MRIERIVNQAAGARPLHSVREWLSVWWRLRIELELFGPPRHIWKGPLFIHIPKTAGSSIIRAGARTAFGHKDYRYYRKWCPPDRVFPEAFTVVRNPYDRVVSAFNYLKAGGDNAYDALWASRNVARYRDVNAFVIDKLEKASVRRWMHFRPQWDFVVDDSGEIGVDWILRFEELGKIWPGVARRLALNPELPTVKASMPGSKSPGLCEESKRVVERVYKDDFKLL